MKWLRIILPIFLLVGMLLCINSVAYADPGDEQPEGDPGDGGNPGDGSGLNVNVTVVGDNPNVNMDVLGENSEVTVNTTGTEVWINGQNLNEPTAVYNNSYSSASAMGVRRVVKDVMFPYMDDIWSRLNLTADGLAKVIQLAQHNESELDSQISLVDTHDDKLTNLGSETTSLGERVAALEARDAALEAQDAAIQAQITANVNYLIASYNRLLLIIIGAFSLVVIGLGAGLFLLWRRTHGARDYIHIA
jgi:hypothetical protein